MRYLDALKGKQQQLTWLYKNNTHEWASANPEKNLTFNSIGYEWLRLSFEPESSSLSNRNWASFDKNNLHTLVTL